MSDEVMKLLCVKHHPNNNTTQCPVPNNDKIILSTTIHKSTNTYPLPANKHDHQLVSIKISDLTHPRADHRIVLGIDLQYIASRTGTMNKKLIEKLGARSSEDINILVLSPMYDAASLSIGHDYGYVVRDANDMSNIDVFINTFVVNS